MNSKWLYRYDHHGICHIFFSHHNHQILYQQEEATKILKTIASLNHSLISLESRVFNEKQIFGT